MRKFNIWAFALATLLPSIAWAADETAGAVATSFMDYLLSMITPARGWMWPMVGFGIAFSLINRWLREEVCVHLAWISLAIFIFGWQPGWIFYLILAWIISKFGGKWIAGMAIGFFTRTKKTWIMLKAILGSVLIFAIVGSETVYDNFGVIPMLILSTGGVFYAIKAIREKGGLKEWWLSIVGKKKGGKTHLLRPLHLPHPLLPRMSPATQSVAAATATPPTANSAKAVGN